VHSHKRQQAFPVLSGPGIEKAFNGYFGKMTGFPSFSLQRVHKEESDVNAVCNPEHLQGFESQQNNLCWHNLKKRYKLFSKCDELLPAEDED